jgi:GxxExxY protein
LSPLIFANHRQSIQFLGEALDESYKRTNPYKDHELNKYYVGDFLAYDQTIVEIKALDALTSQEEAQLINQLKASKLPLGLKLILAIRTI